MKVYRNGIEINLNQDEMDIVASYMNDEIREDLHGDLAPCEPNEFLIEYVKRDHEFEALLDNEFDIEVK